MSRKANQPNGNAHRAITFLTREELDFLDKIGKDALFSSGSKLSRSKIISAIVNAMRKLNIDGCGLRSKRELEGRIIQAIKNNSITDEDKPKQKIDHQERKGERNEPAA